MSDIFEIPGALYTQLIKYRHYLDKTDGAIEYTDEIWADQKKLKEVDLKNLSITLDNVDFKHRGRVHEWKNYIDHEFIEVWDSLPKDYQILLFYFAVKQAADEFWD